MDINKNSWHYRLLHKLDMINWSGENLCPYFWKVVFTLTLLPTLGLMILVILLLPLWWSFTTLNLALPILVAIVDIACLILLLKVMVSERHDEEVLLGTREQPITSHKEASLFRLWLQAKHRKVCPLINFVNDKSGG